MKKSPFRRRWGRLLLPALLLLFPGPLRALPDLPEFPEPYWEAPERLSPEGGKFPVTAFYGSLAVAAWQENAPFPGASGGITVSLAVKDGGEPWRISRSLGGPYPFFGTEPSIISASVDPWGRIILAVAASSTRTELLVSDDRGKTFSRGILNFGSETSVAPRIFSRPEGGYYLFITRGGQDSLNISYAVSAEGRSWSPFESLVRDERLRLNFLPSYASLGGVDYVVFQSLVKENGGNSAFHLFLCSSSDAGRTWTPPRQLTAPEEGAGHQRPSLSVREDRLYLVWERRLAGGPPAVFGAFIQYDGSLSPEHDRISAADTPCHNPIAFTYREAPAAVWFDTHRGTDRVFFAQGSGGNWRNRELAAGAFVRPLLGPDGLSLLWQAADLRGVEGIYLLRPDPSLITPPEAAGTVKFGDFSSLWEPSWRVRASRPPDGDPPIFVMAGLFLLGSLGFISTARGLGSVLSEGALLRLTAAALITGDLLPLEKQTGLKRIRKRGGGLRLKLASFTAALVLLVVVMVSVPVYYRMIRTQRETLLQGLWDRSAVLLEGLASNARIFLPARNVLELGFLPAQSSAVPEARYVTITGYGLDSTRFDDHVWATNDPDIRSKIDTPEFLPGVSRLQDALSPRLPELTRELDSRAQAELGEISARIAELTREGVGLAVKSDAASRRRLEEIQSGARALETKLSQALAAISGEPGSEPAFSKDAFSRSGIPKGPSPVYIFFKPVLYRQGSEAAFFRGLIRLEVSLDSIIGKIAEGRRLLLHLILAVGLSALGLGALGALALSTLIIRPIRRLAAHVELIRDTEDKTRLAGADIHINSRDEIAFLADTINDMTRRLVRAARSSRDLSIGQEIQKKFLPLQVNREGNKLNFGSQETPALSFFGYYQGAKGVSGDYFDYLDLDGRYFAIIKCDVAGKGVPAALIMIQVATLFRSYFKSWKATPRGMRIEEAVYQINEFIETLAFEGWFAAFTLCLFDSQTGLARFCNAGDNLIRWYDASEGAMKSRTLRESPAAGVLPNAVIAAKGGYTVETITFDPGDILFLYTDGIEEAGRVLRESAEGPRDASSDPRPAGWFEAEELGSSRVIDIINAVMNRRRYTLRRGGPPGGEGSLQFDFTRCEGAAEEAVMALIAIEKIFRSYPISGGEASRVPVDKKIDRFLRSHFLRYRDYCFPPQEIPGNDECFYYTRLKEDDQYDDITILAVKRK
ncbi:MAG: SpoIIE family protein phosphatase, partial [Spirochaetaceae bacterium]|nr:SpoIIE family protein phosphatase [Spirochaetaceae bacterium]